MKHRIVTAAQMKEIERAGDVHGLPYLQMMENAGLAAYAELQKQLLAPSGVFDMDGFPLLRVIRITALLTFGGGLNTFSSTVNKYSTSYQA